MMLFIDIKTADIYYAKLMFAYAFITVAKEIFGVYSPEALFLIAETCAANERF